MWLAVESVKNKSSDIIISAGNTGALLVIAKLNLKMIENIDKPALSGLWPSKKGMSVVLDLGANIECSDKNLIDFAIMGSSLFKSLFPDEKSYEANKGQFKIGIASGWFVRQYDGDFNPQHFHTGCQISTIGFLKLPDDIDAYWKEEDKDHNPFGGYTDFRYGTIGLNCPNNMKIKPKVGEFYMFPNWLDHQVYPFRSKYKKPDVKGERRSFSLNIVYQNVKEDRNKNQSES